MNIVKRTPDNLLVIPIGILIMFIWKGLLGTPITAIVVLE